MEPIKSYTENNSVKVVAFAMELSKKLSNQEISSIVAGVKNSEFFQKEFDNFVEQDEFSMTIGPDSTPIPVRNMNGLVCSKEQDWSFLINKEVIVITCKLYESWISVSNQAYEYIKNALGLIPYGTNIEHVTLEYLDEFEIIDNTFEWKKVLFQENCSYITSNIYDINDFWNVKQGYFLKLKDLDHQLLDTIDINYFLDREDNDKHKINIITQHKLYINNDDIAKLRTFFDVIHSHSKEIFSKIVNNKILEKFN